LEAIRPPNDFRISFLSSYALHLSRDQIIRPHGLDIAKTRHIHFGTFNTSSVRFAVFVLFPNAAQGSISSTSASENTLSLERHKDFYDQIVIPAVYETIPDPFHQEIPQSYDMVYAKSRSFEEKVGNNRWGREDQSRALRLEYKLPALSLGRFWGSVVNRANSTTIPTRSGSTVSYFRDPQLLFQAHDLKNTFCQSSIQEVLLLFGDTVLEALDAHHIDIRSCWLDIRCRDHASVPDAPRSANAGPLTLLWKDRCNRALHERICELAPKCPLDATYYRSFLFRDVSTYQSKSKSTRRSNPAHPDSIKPGIIRAKAYNCVKEMFAVMFSDYHVFGSGFLPLLSLSDEMIDDFWASSHNCQRAPTTQISRSSLVRSWEANKRHLKSISQADILASYGVRKEVTFGLETILTMWDRCYFDPETNPEVGQITRTMSLRSDDTEHYPFWVVPTRDLKAMILTQAARLILPLDHLFNQASTQSSVESGDLNKGELSVRLVLSLYTAQLFCRLLIHALNDEEHAPYDNWIWLKEWVVRDRFAPRRFRLRRQGLGLDRSITTSGMLWIPLEAMDWCNGHISLRRLVDIYIPRSPLQSYLISQSNIQSVTTSKVTVEILLLQRIEQVRQLWEDGRQSEGKRLAYDTAKFATQKITRAYNLHLLHKLESMWDRLRAKEGRSSLPSLQRFKHNMKEVAAQCSQMVTAQTIWEIYILIVCPIFSKRGSPCRYLRL
jgi:hypothetical protein